MHGPSRRDPRSAYEELSRALRRDPGNTRLAREVAAALLELGQRQEALELLDSVAAINLQQGNFAEVATICGTILALDSGNLPTLRMIRHLRQMKLVTPTELDQALEIPSRLRVVEGRPIVLVGPVDTELPDDAAATRELDLLDGPTSPPRAQGLDSGATPPSAAPGMAAQATPSPEEPTAIQVRSPFTGSVDPESVATMAAGTIPLATSEIQPAVDGANSVFDDPRLTPAPLDPGEEVTQPPLENPLGVLDLPRWSTRLSLPGPLLALGTERRARRGDLLCQEEAPCEALILLKQGSAAVTKWEGSERCLRLALVGDGACLGELALLGDGRPHYTVRALDSCQLLTFTRGKVKEEMSRSPELSQRMRGLYRDRLTQIALRSAPLLRQLPMERARAILNLARPVRLMANQVIIHEGEPASGLYLILLGHLEMTRTAGEDRHPVLLGHLRDGDFFGEGSLLQGQASARVRSRSFTQLVHLPPDAFDDVSRSSPAFFRVVEAEAKRRELVHHSILSDAAYFDEERGEVVERRR